MGFIFDGTHSDEYKLIVKTKRQILPDIDDKYIDIPGRDGAYLVSGKAKDRLFHLRCQLEFESLEALRALVRNIAAWLYTDTKSELVFDDEPDITYIAKLSGAIEYETAKAYGEFDIVFRAEPFGLSAQESINFGATFTRASTAYTQAGVEVGAGSARFEAAKFGSGIMIEPGTTNLLTANQSSVETDLTGFTALDAATLTRDTVEHWHGIASLKVVTSGTVNGVRGGARTDAITALANTSFSGSVWAKGVGTVRVYLKDATNGVTSNIVTLSLTSSWQRVVCKLTTGASAVTDLGLYMEEDVADSALTFYVDGLQIEQRNYTTSWTLGGLTRSDETLTLSTRWNKDAWSIEFWLIPYTIPLSGWSPIRDLFNLKIDADNYYRIFTYTDLRPVFEVKRAGTNRSTYSGLEPVLAPGGIYHIAATGNATVARLYLDGVLVGQTTSGADIRPIGNLPENTYIGSDPSGAGQANGVLDDLRISQVVRSASEIANAYASATPAGSDANTLYYLSMDNNYNYSAVVNITASHESYPVITATINTAATELKVLHYESGKYLRIVKSLAAGDVIVFDCAKSAVSQNGVYIMSYLDLASDFFALNSGKNTIISTTSGAPPTVNITYKPRWR